MYPGGKRQNSRSPVRSNSTGSLRRMTSGSGSMLSPLYPAPSSSSPSSADKENLLNELGGIPDILSFVANEMQGTRERCDRFCRFARELNAGGPPDEKWEPDRSAFADLTKVFLQFMGLHKQLLGVLRDAERYMETTQAGLAFLEGEKETYRNNEKVFQKTQRDYLHMKPGKLSPDQLQQEDAKYVSEKRVLELQKFRLHCKLEEVRNAEEQAPGTFLIQAMTAFTDFIGEAALLVPVAKHPLAVAKATLKKSEEQWTSRQNLLDMVQADMELGVDRAPRTVSVTSPSSPLVIRDLTGGDSPSGVPPKTLRGTLFSYPIFGQVHVSLQDNALTLTYEKEVVVLPCMLCSVKEAREQDRRFLFCVATPQKNHVLQADSASEMQKWISAIQGSILAGLGSGSGESAKDENETLEALWMACPQNRVCADCEAPDPDWCVINMGCLICMACSGLHRNLGVHISKVRSLRLDKLSKPSLAFMLAMGNKQHNLLWEAVPPQEINRKRRDEFIKAKYEQKLFMRKGLQVSGLQALEQKNYSALLSAVILADINTRLEGQSGRTLLHVAVEHYDCVAVELLIQNDADVRAAEDRGWTPLCYAAFLGNPDAVRVLLERGGSYLLKLTDLEEKTPLDIARENNSPQSETVQILLEFLAVEDERARRKAAEEKEKGKVIEALPPKKKEWKMGKSKTLRLSSVTSSTDSGDSTIRRVPVDEILLEGALMKKSPSGKNRFQERYFELWPSTLIYRKKKGGEMAGEIPLASINEGRLIERADKKCGEFELDVRTTEADAKKYGAVRTFTMNGTVIEASIWLKAILKQVDVLKLERHSQERVSGEREPGSLSPRASVHLEK